MTRNHNWNDVDETLRQEAALILRRQGYIAHRYYDETEDREMLTTDATAAQVESAQAQAAD